MLYRRAALLKGFTLIELLVVISIIGLLSSVVLASLSAVRVKARDARRMSDMAQIWNALNLYSLQYDCLPTTTGSTCGTASGTYSEGNAGGWDYSSQGGFMQFLSSSGIMPTVPTDPVNNMTGDGSPAGTFGYRYYCYPPAIGPTLGYWLESGGGNIWKVYQMPGYTCK